MRARRKARRARAKREQVGWASHQEMLWLRLAPRLARAARPLARFAVPATAIGVASLAKPASCSPFGDEIDATMREVFSLLKQLFGKQQLSSLMDYIQGSIMLNYNDRAL